MGEGGSVSAPVQQLGVGWWAHVLPIADTREHAIDIDCRCDPRCEHGMVVHNADDGREKFESGQRAPS